MQQDFDHQATHGMTTYQKTTTPDAQHDQDSVSIQTHLHEHESLPHRKNHATTPSNTLTTSTYQSTPTVTTCSLHRNQH